MKKTGAIIVAAGLSSRMHDFKPMLPFSKSTIARHNVAMFKALGLEPIVVITGYRAEELEEHLVSAGVHFKRNEDYETTEMFDSIKLGIKELIDKCDRMLIMPIDIPAIFEDTYRAVLAENAHIVRASHDGRPGHPIVIDKETAMEFLDYHGENGLKGAIHAHSIPPVDVEVFDEGINRDVDTPEEYNELIKWHDNQNK
ncbi:MAG: nucleotidyltransferase family protein [Pseudobutyrivibrio sp.]|nr:nucleotidyltransferase family protein [Pseudobutyrivibrio sp.]